MTAQRKGQHYRDQVGYSAEAVAAYLPGVWDEDFVLSARPAKAAPDGPRAKGDPRHVPDWLLAVADVQVGYVRAQLTEVEKVVLRHVYHLGFTPGELSEIWGEPAERINATCMAGVHKIATYLSGRSPA